MNIFIMRHGEAEMWARSDDARQLTPHGKQQALEQGLFLKQLAKGGLLFDKVLLSPYVRAKETFAEIDHVFDYQLSPKLEVWQGITPYGSATVVCDYLALLAQQENIQNLLLISHLPLVDEIVRHLCGRSGVSFYPATIAQVEWLADKAQLLEIKYPDLRKE